MPGRAKIEETGRGKDLENMIRGGLVDGRIEHIRRVIVTGGSRGEEVVHTVYTMALPSRLDEDEAVYRDIRSLRGRLEEEKIEEVKLVAFDKIDFLRLRKMTEHVFRQSVVKVWLGRHR